MYNFSIYFILYLVPEDGHVSGRNM